MFGRDYIIPEILGLLGVVVLTLYLIKYGRKVVVWLMKKCYDIFVAHRGTKHRKGD